VEVDIYLKIIRLLAILCIFAGVVGWIVTFSVDPYTNPLAMSWMATRILNPIGVVLSIILLIKKIKYGLLLLVLNLIMTISVAPMWFLIDFFNMLSSHKP
jgi:uncharacterized membrane protein HdeD (DUF308 family)